jgi:phage tail sheath protein FI
MAIEQFRFVSPGVQINEIDESVIQPTPPAIGPVVIGRTARGPAMQPVVVNNVSELERVFGAASNGTVGATDVWRTGVPTAPTFATYAAKAFLRNSSPVTVVRLAGVEKGTGQTGDPGWSVTTAYGVYAVSSSTAKLAGVVYMDSGFALEVSNSVGGFTSDGSGSYASNAGNLFVSASTGRTQVPFSLVPTSGSFLRNVLNTNPTKFSDKGYFLGESFENSLPASVSSIYVKALTGWNSHASASLNAESGWVTGDHASGSDPIDLFKFVGLNSGASLSKEIKISIENVRASRNTNVTKYGTFDVVVRKLYETGTDTVLERFTGVSLDVNSDDYIAKRIGDSYRAWDATNSHYVEYGSYPNRSAYVRVEVNAAEDIPATALPHGFRIKGVPDLANVGGLTTSHADFALLTSSVRLSAAKSTRFGLVADATNNADLVDILSQKPAVTPEAEALFSTRYISGSATAVEYEGSSFYNATDLLTAGTVLGFNMPMHGGFDGVDITEAEPLVNARLLDGEDETTSAAYRSVKQAIDIVSNPEVVDMNILCVPNLKDETLTSYMISTCRARGDAMAIIDLNGDYEYSWETNVGTEARPTSTTDVITNLTARAIDDSYGAAYFPYVFVASEGIFMPSSIAALGAFGGTEGRSALWFAPAGFNRGGLTEANAGIGVSRTALQLNASDRDDLYAANINPIATFPNEGVLIFGQKTLQVTPSALDRVNVRRLLNYIKKQVSRAATRVLFEPNIEATWNNFKGVVDPFLLAIKNAYGLDDAKVVLDSTTTTADLVDRNIMYCKIFVKPTRAIEYIAIDFVVTNSGAAFTE